MGNRGWPIGVLLVMPMGGVGAETDLLDESFETLQQVTLASKRDERPAEAAASVTLFTQEDIQRTGYETLYQLAEVTPGYSSYRIYGEKVLATRGQKAGSFNNSKHLLLFDGVPINFARNYKASVGEELPLHGMQRVEFLRGPGSALYGTSAFFGVIGVDPRPISWASQGSLVTGVASRDGEWRTGGAANVLHGENYTLARVGVARKGDSLAPAGNASLESYRYRDKESDDFLWLSHGFVEGPMRGLSMNLLYQNKEGGLGETWSGTKYSDPYNRLRWEQVIPYLKYDRKLDDHWRIGGYLKYGQSSEAGRTRSSEGSRGVYEYRQRDVAAQVEAQWSSGSTHLTFGYEFDSRKEGIPGSFEYEYGPNGGVKNSGYAGQSEPYRTQSYYAQWQENWKMLAGATSTLGARSDCLLANGQEQCKISPRFSFVQRFDPGWTAKFLYGEALRAPGFKEVELNRVSAAAGAPALSALSAENFKSYEFNVEYGGALGYVGSSLFSNTTSNALDGVSSGGHNYFRNSPGETRADGLELYGKRMFNGGWSVQTELSLVKAKQPSGEAVTDVPTRKGSLILAHPLLLGEKRTEMAWIARGVGGFRGPAGSTPPAGFVFVDAHWRIPLQKDLSLSLQGFNLLDKVAYLPKSGMADVPLPRRTFWLNLRAVW